VRSIQRLEYQLHFFTHEGKAPHDAYDFVFDQQGPMANGGDQHRRNKKFQDQALNAAGSIAFGKRRPPK
jgi:hypothetical protein